MEFLKRGPAAEEILSPSRVRVLCTLYTSMSQLIAMVGGRYLSQTDSCHGSSRTTVEVGKWPCHDAL